MKKLSKKVDPIGIPLVEMSNAIRRHTGLPGVIYFCTKEEACSPPAKALGQVKWINAGQAVSISIKGDKEGKRKITGSNRRMTSLLELFVLINEAILWEYWNTPKDEADSAETMKKFKKVQSKYLYGEFISESIKPAPQALDLFGFPLKDEVARVGREGVYEFRIYPEPLGEPSFHIVSSELEIVVAIKDLKILEIKKVGKSKHKLRKGRPLTGSLLKTVLKFARRDVEVLTGVKRKLFLMATWNLNNPGFEIEPSYIKWK